MTKGFDITISRENWRPKPVWYVILIRDKHSVIVCSQWGTVSSNMDQQQPEMVLEQHQHHKITKLAFALMITSEAPCASCHWIAKYRNNLILPLELIAISLWSLLHRRLPKKLIARYLINRILPRELIATSLCSLLHRRLPRRLIARYLLNRILFRELIATSLWSLLHRPLPRRMIARYQLNRILPRELIATSL